MGNAHNFYSQICKRKNLVLAWKNARKRKTKKRYVKRFEANLRENILELQKELINETYKPDLLKNFVLRDPKTRKISKSTFRDRVVHHALCNIIVPIFQKGFIFDSHANQIGKGTHKALERLDKFKRKVSKNHTRVCYVFKADIKHYFEEIDHSILLEIIKKKIPDKKVLGLIQLILSNQAIGRKRIRGMPLGNLTSQFFANLYLNELDQYVKHKLRAKYYIRYVDDFVILHHNNDVLEDWKNSIGEFLREKLGLELHPNKSKVIKLDHGLIFLGFRVFFYHKLLRKSNMISFERKFNQLKIYFDEGVISREKIVEFLEGWFAYASHSNTYKYKKYILRDFNRYFSFNKRKEITKTKKLRNFIKKLDESELQFSPQKTLFLYNRGMSIKEISIRRKIKESTIWEHFVNLIEHKQISVWKIIPKGKIYKVLSKIYSKNDKLKDIRKRLKDETISYNEIACVLASIKSKKK